MQMTSMPDASGIRSFWTRQALCRKSSSQGSAGVSSMMMSRSISELLRWSPRAREPNRNVCLAPEMLWSRPQSASLRLSSLGLLLFSSGVGPEGLEVDSCVSFFLSKRRVISRAARGAPMQIAQRSNAPATRYHPSSLLVMMATAGRMLTARPVKMITGVFIQKKISLSLSLSGLRMMMSPFPTAGCWSPVGAGEIGLSALLQNSIRLMCRRKILPTYAQAGPAPGSGFWSSPPGACSPQYSSGIITVGCWASRPR